jgi:hypothetical protein
MIASDPDLALALLEGSFLENPAMKALQQAIASILQTANDPRFTDRILSLRPLLMTQPGELQGSDQQDIVEVFGRLSDGFDSNTKRVINNKMSDVLTCLGCGGLRVKHHESYILHLSLQGELPEQDTIEIQDLIKAFFQLDRIEGDVHCAMCKKKTPSTKRTILHELGETVLLCIKGFNNHLQKVPNTITFSAGATVEIPVDGENVQCQVTSQAWHNGTLETGHYVCEVFSNGTTIRMNDGQMTLEEGNPQHAGYFLLLKKEGNDSSGKLERALECSKKFPLLPFYEPQDDQECENIEFCFSARKYFAY